MTKKSKRQAVSAEPEPERSGAIVHHTTECRWCGKQYIEPCDSAARAKKCGNAKLK